MPNFLAIASLSFLSSVSHCYAMCGGFNTLHILRLQSKKDRFFASFVYHISRIFAYCILGVVFGSFGQYLALSGNSRSVLFFIVGLFLIFLSFALFLRGDLLRIIENQRFSNFIFRKIKKITDKNKITSFFFLGFLNGFLPCGVVYYFLAMSISFNSAIIGFLIMFVFGICTMPALMLLNFIGLTISDFFKQFSFYIFIFAIFINGIYLSFLGFYSYS